jgi:hypothetical protein
MDTYLEKYKPELPDILKDFDIDDEGTEEEHAFKVYKMLLVAKRNNEAMFLVIGKLLKEIRDKELYGKLDYESFSQFLASEEVGYSRESAYLFIRSYEYLIQHLQLNPQVVGKMNIGRINMMIPVIKKIEEEQGIDEAIKMIGDLDHLRHGDFVQKIQDSRKSEKPDVYYSEEQKKWVVNYFEDTTVLHSKGVFAQEGEFI